jgi:hypothetical protein
MGRESTGSDNARRGAAISRGDREGSRTTIALIRFVFLALLRHRDWKLGGLPKYSFDPRHEAQEVEGETASVKVVGAEGAADEAEDGRAGGGRIGRSSMTVMSSPATRGAHVIALIEQPLFAESQFTRYDIDPPESNWDTTPT